MNCFLLKYEHISGNTILSLTLQYISRLLSCAFVISCQFNHVPLSFLAYVIMCICQQLKWLSIFLQVPMHAVEYLSL
jgi:hypothetical protein